MGLSVIILPKFWTSTSFFIVTTVVMPWLSRPAWLNVGLALQLPLLFPDVHVCDHCKLFSTLTQYRTVTASVPQTRWQLWRLLVVVINRNVGLSFVSFGYFSNNAEQWHFQRGWAAGGTGPCRFSSQPNAKAVYLETCIGYIMWTNV